MSQIRNVRKWKSSCHVWNVSHSYQLHPERQKGVDYLIQKNIRQASGLWGHSCLSEALPMEFHFPMWTPRLPESCKKRDIETKYESMKVLHYFWVEAPKDNPCSPKAPRKLYLGHVVRVMQSGRIFSSCSIKKSLTFDIHEHSATNVGYFFTDTLGRLIYNVRLSLEVEPWQ